MVTEAALRGYLDQIGLNPERFDIPKLLQILPTDRAWLSASEADVARAIPEAMRRRATEVREVVQTALRDR